MRNKTLKVFTTLLTMATLCSVPVMAAPSNEYILLLPKTEGITYNLAQDHVADQYSNDQYTVLLYKEGENVSLTVNGATDFIIKDAMDSDVTDYAANETDGKVSFSMPAEDLSLNINGVSEEAVSAAKAASETETESETQSETYDETTSKYQGGSNVNVPSDIRITSTRVNVRKAADANSDKISVLTIGERVRILSEENGWTRLQFVHEGTLVEGYVKSDYLLEPSALYVSKVNVNVRSAASEKSEKIGKIEAGTEIVVVENDQNGWNKIRYINGKTVKDGFVKADYLEQETTPMIDELLKK